MRQPLLSCVAVLFAGIISLLPAAPLQSYIPTVLAIENGLARTPPMGWNDWNRFGCDINSQIVKETADALVASGMKDAGYQYVNVDDCWSAQTRDADGNLQPDSTKFPDGIKAVADYVHSKGLKFGIYATAGYATCAGFPGSHGHEQQDANTFASWGVDYLKYDFCGHPNLDSAAPGFDKIAVSGPSVAASYEAESSANTLDGGARVAGCPCSGGLEVDNVGHSSGTLQFNDVTVPTAGDYQLTIYWVNENASQRAFMSVNGNPGTRVDFPVAPHWQEVNPVTVTVTLQAGANTIRFYNDLTEQENTALLYARMRDALQATGRPIIYSICDWGIDQPSAWGPNTGNSWRTSNDIRDNWGSIMTALDQQIEPARSAGPGHWNDPDMLEVGNGGMTDTEYRAHFSLWSILAAPLIVGTDARAMSQATRDILLNKDVIAVDQDPAGIEGALVSPGEQEVWVRPLVNGDRAVVLLNRGATSATISATVGSLGLPAAPVYIVRDLWTHTETTSGGVVSAFVPPHGATMLRVRTSAVGEAPPAVLLSVDPALLTAGQTSTVTTTLANNSLSAIGTGSINLTGPAGWTVSRTAPMTTTLLPNQSMRVTWDVMPPVEAQSGLTATLQATGIYTYTGTSGPTTLQAAAVLQLSPPAAARSAYLSDLSWVDATSGSGIVQQDKSVTGGPLSLNGATYAKGIGTHGYSQITYDLAGNYTQFSCDVGVDDGAGTRGSVVFQVWADGRKLYDSGLMVAGAPIQRIRLNIADVRSLTLVVTDGGDGNDYDHGDWASAYVSFNPSGPNNLSTPTIPTQTSTPLPATETPSPSPSLTTPTPSPTSLSTSTPTPTATHTPTTSPTPTATPPLTSTGTMTPPLIAPSPTLTPAPAATPMGMDILVTNVSMAPTSTSTAVASTATSMPARNTPPTNTPTPPSTIALTTPKTTLALSAIKTSTPTARSTHRATEPQLRLDVRIGRATIYQGEIETVLVRTLPNAHVSAQVIGVRGRKPQSIRVITHKDARDRWRMLVTVGTRTTPTTVQIKVVARLGGRQTQVTRTFRVIARAHGPLNPRGHTRRHNLGRRTRR